MKLAEKEAMTPSFVYEGEEYFNRKNSAKYVGMTDSGLRRRMDDIEKEINISFPLVSFPVSCKSWYINKKILDLLRKPIIVEQEHKWIEELKQVIQQEYDTKKL